MQNRDIDRQIKAIKLLFDKTNTACGEDYKLMSHWAKYLCVATAGLLENALPSLFADLIQSAASTHVTAYVKNRLSKIKNPATGRFLETAGAFKTEWKDNLTQYVDTDGRREAIDSIMENRNKIAHGKPSNITVAYIRDYMTKSVEVLEFIESRLV